jgi:uncharacterized membrane protein
MLPVGDLIIARSRPDGFSMRGNLTKRAPAGQIKRSQDINVGLSPRSNMHTINTHVSKTRSTAKRSLLKKSLWATLLAGTSIAYLSLAGPVLAHDETPPPYPEPLDSSPRLAPEVVQGPLTMLYVGIGVVGVALVLSLLLMWQRQRSRQSAAEQTSND